MKHTPIIISVLAFFATLVAIYLIGTILKIEWLIFYSFTGAPSGGFLIEADISWIPIILAILVSYLSWNLASRKFANE